MFQRKRTGSILCPSCGRLTGVADEQCANCGRRNPGMWGLTSILGTAGRAVPFDQVVIGGSVFLYLCMLVVDPEGVGRRFNFLNLLPPSRESSLRFGATGALPLWQLGRWWTVLSAGWLHANLLHIYFNLSWLRVLAPGVAELYGPSRMVVLYTFSSAFAFLLTSTFGQFLPFGAHSTVVGASAAIFGLLGALIWYGRATGSRMLSKQVWSWTIGGIIFGFIFPMVDNWAHLGGFAGGYIAAQLLDPRKPERPVHVALALVCLAATVAAIVASLVVPLPPSLLERL
ncbi:MAG TPA: rhomboid family intramembrane serine protease [Thermoanaerobaculia bacterium]|nr:rhomboid family intramembrane serine protease [Thermoanaerobaculia bacterium]